MAQYKIIVFLILVSLFVVTNINNVHATDNNIIRFNRTPQSQLIDHYLLSSVSSEMEPTIISKDGNIHFMKIDAEGGNVLASNLTRLYYSSNYGNNFNLVNTFSTAVTSIHISKDSSYAIIGTHNGEIWRTTDYSEFENVFNLSSGSFINVFSIDSYGNIIYLSEYDDTDSPVDNRAWKSEDSGDTWTEIFNATQEIGSIVRHIHITKVDPYTGDVYISTGDALDNGTLFYSNDTGDSWNILAGQPYRRIYGIKISQNWMQPTSAIFSEDYAMFGTDKPSYISIWKYPKDGTWGSINRDVALESATGVNGNFIDAEYKNGVTYWLLEGFSGLNKSALFVGDKNSNSIIKVYEFDDADSQCYTDIATDNVYVYTACKEISSDDPTYRFKLLTEKQVNNLLYYPYLENNDNTWSSEEFLILNNETHYLSLIQNPLTNAQLIINPINVTNLVENPSFEDWDSTNPDHWDTTYPSDKFEKITDFPYHGNNAVHMIGNETAKWWRQHSNADIPVQEGETFRISYYQRFNSSEISLKYSDYWRVWWFDSEASLISSVDVDFEKGYDGWYYKDHETYWTRVISEPFTAPENAVEMRTHTLTETYNQDYWLDAVQIQKDVGWATPFISEFGVDKAPEDIILTITSDSGTEIINIEGNLTNQYIYNFTNTITGITSITLSSGGSGAVNLTLLGDIVEETDTCTLQERIFYPIILIVLTLAILMLCLCLLKGNVDIKNMQEGWEPLTIKRLILTFLILIFTISILSGIADTIATRCTL